MNQNNRNFALHKPFLNIGCGRRYHQSWTNIDLESDDPNVITHDITSGLPFADNSFDAVYHSHVLEHLSPGDGEKLFEECHRVLKPGGVHRIVVPNLERIAELYLDCHRGAWAGDESAAVNYHWMKLELLDQMVRSRSGGEMGQYMSGGEIKNPDFVRSRVGDEFSRCQEIGLGEGDSAPEKLSLRDKAILSIRQSKLRVTRWIVKRLMGRNALRSFDEGLFRSQGEIHRWMYDRYSLKELCAGKGFTEFRVQTATQSDIDDYASFSLDARNGRARKPDSLFVECRKPEIAARIRAA